MTFADNQTISIEMLKMKFSEEAQYRKSKRVETARKINHIKLIFNVLLGTEDKEDKEKFGKELTIAANTERWTNILSIICQHLHAVGLVRKTWILFYEH